MSSLSFSESCCRSPYSTTPVKSSAEIYSSMKRDLSALQSIGVVLLISILVAGCSMFKKEVVDENATVEELYARAKESIDKNNWGTAIERLRELEAKYPYGVYAEQAQLDTAFAYYKNSEPGLATAAADRFIKLHPAHESVDYAYYLKGLASYEEDKSTIGYLLGKDDLSDRDPTLTLTALNAFKDVYTLFPESQYAASSRERVTYLTNALARHEINVANYYYSKDAYVAVVNRAKEVIEAYPDTPAVEDALGLLYASYLKMGLSDLAEDSRRVLELNFPNSNYLDVDGIVVVNAHGVREKKRGWFSSLRNVFRRSPSS